MTFIQAGMKYSHIKFNDYENQPAAFDINEVAEFFRRDSSKFPSFFNLFKNQHKRIGQKDYNITDDSELKTNAKKYQSFKDPYTTSIEISMQSIYNTTGVFTEVLLNFVLRSCINLRRIIINIPINLKKIDIKEVMKGVQPL